MVRSFPVRFAMIDSDSTVVLVFQLLFPDPTIYLRSSISAPTVRIKRRPTPLQFGQLAFDARTCSDD